MRDADRPVSGSASGSPSAGGDVEPTWQVVVLSWNGREDTLRCLDSLREVDDPRLRVVCVDNGSSDGSVEAVRRGFPEVHLIENNRNLGFSGGNNVGIRWALEQGADWVVLVNNDVTVAADAFVAFAEAARAHPTAGILAGKLFMAERPDRIWFAGHRFHAWLGYSGRHRGEGRRDRPQYRRTTPTGRATGALLAVSRAAIERIGLLDEELFAYVEDVDWSLRAREAGLEVHFVPEARGWHRVAGATGGAGSTHGIYYGTRNTIVVCERHRPLPPPFSWVRRWVVLATFVAYALRRRNRRQRLQAARDGYRDARAGRLGPRLA